MKWSEMTPRERDALVAERVMGWTEKEYDDIYRHDWRFRRPNGEWHVAPEFTTNISAAWEIMGKMQQDGWDIEVEYAQRNRRWEARFYRGDSGFWWWSTDTAPEAICLAALKAVGAEVEA